MDRKMMHKTVEISAPRAKVWDVLIKDEHTRLWYSEFSPGSHAEGGWSVGSRIAFTDASGSGLVGKVTAIEPYERIAIEHQAVVMAGKEDASSEEAQKWKGARESYLLKERDGSTVLTVEQELPEDYMEPLSALWDKALAKIRDLAELQ